MTDWEDIGLHTLPTIAVGIAMGFMAAFGFNSPTTSEMWFWLVISVTGMLGFSFMWIRRERRQHRGYFGGTQSVLEGVLPAIAGPVSYVLSTTVFWKLDI